jgi:hypothetical protein
MENEIQSGHARLRNEFWRGFWTGMAVAWAIAILLMKLLP